MTPNTSPLGLLTFLIIVSLATARLTRLIVTDTIFRRPRDWFQQRYHGMLVNLTFCVWCVSVWFAAGLTVLGYFCWTWARWPMLGLAAATVVGILAEKAGV